MAAVAGLWVYPLKSGQGIRVDSLAAGPRGLDGDRRWMVVDAKRHFLTQRQLPVMARLRALPAQAGLTLSVGDDDDALDVPLPGAQAPVRRVQIWGRGVAALGAGEAAAAWLSEHLGRRCELVYLAPRMDRALPPGYARAAGEVVGFADAFHALLIGDATLAELNQRLVSRGVAPVPLDRFRPNISIRGLAAGEEDGWRRIAIGQVEFRVAKPCERCLVTTVDQHSGARDPDREPLRTLQMYRADASGNALFGQNLVAESTGVLRPGDPVKLLE